MTRVLSDLTVLSSPSRARGIGRYVADVALGVAARTPKGELWAVEELPWLGEPRVTSDVVGAVSRLLRGGQRLTHPEWAYRVRTRLAAASHAAHATLVHSGHPEATPLGALGCPRVVTCHDLIELMYPDRYLTWRDGYGPGRVQLDARRYGSADHVIAVSETTAHELVARLSIPASKITVVHNGVDLKRFSSTPRARDADVLSRRGLARAPYLLYVGGADWRKNPDGMFRALRDARRQQPGLELRLAWAGKLERDEHTELARSVASYGLGSAVVWLGFVSDEELGALSRGAVAELFVSRAEGFGYPVVEAMASGCPVITSNCSSMAEIAGDAALLVDPERAEAIADAIVALATSDAERARLRALGLARAQRFSLERMAEETLAVYRSLAP